MTAGRIGDRRYYLVYLGNGNGVAAYMAYDSPPECVGCVAESQGIGGGDAGVAATIARRTANSPHRPPHRPLAAAAGFYSSGAVVLGALVQLVVAAGRRLDREMVVAVPPGVDPHAPVRLRTVFGVVLDAQRSAALRVADQRGPAIASLA